MRGGIVQFGSLMDWQIKPLARHSWLTEEPFVEGERVLCHVFLDEEGELQRADIKEDEAEQLSISGELLGKWGRIVKAKVDEEREARQQVLLSSEELFLSMQETEHESLSEDAEILCYLLALMLERKRILRAQGRPVDGTQRYLHVKSKREYEVKVVDLMSQRVPVLQAQVEKLIG